MNKLFLISEFWVHQPLSLIDSKEYIMRRCGLKFLTFEEDADVYRAFMAFKREHRVFLYLGKKEYLVRKATFWEDICKKVDLVAHKNGKMYYIQVKSNSDFLEPKEISEFNIFCRNKNATGIYAIVSRNRIMFRKIIGGK
ncbi:MAG: hypothetical protein LBD63_02435 [Mycoplasmataceae bacterium]|jgi:hypothetical protein|nr:hypothetical protein [Mycoplasmataceae bacterium]